MTTPDAPAPHASLRGAALRGGAFLAGRHSLSLVIHLLGVMLLTRAIGPNNYGVYVGALGVQTYLYAVSSSGSSCSSSATAKTVSDAEFDQAFTLLGAIGVSVATIVFFALPIVEGWIGIEAFAAVGRALVIVLPIQLLGLVPMGRLERALKYRVIAPAELGGYIVFYRRRASAGAARISRVGAGRGILDAADPHDRGIVLASRYRPRLAVESPAHSRDGGLRRELLRARTGSGSSATS